jgi:C4-dicarboxylate-specific signal transduction histidine kinase
MADEEIPENVDLRFLAEQLKRVLEQTKLIPKLVKDVSELQVAVAATRADLGRTNEHLEKISETQQNQGARLNAIDGRLALIEKHTGMVKA